MALCDYCDQEMTAADGCTSDPIVTGGDSYPPVRYGLEPGFKGARRRCGDCNVLPGRVHHHGCERGEVSRLRRSVDRLWLSLGR